MANIDDIYTKAEQLNWLLTMMEYRLGRIKIKQKEVLDMQRGLTPDAPVTGQICPKCNGSPVRIIDGEEWQCVKCHGIGHI